MGAAQKQQAIAWPTWGLLPPACLDCWTSCQLQQSSDVGLGPMLTKPCCCVCHSKHMLKF